MAKKKDGNKAVSAPRSIQNRRARHEYAVLEQFEAGLALVGSEVKSLFLGKGHLTDAFCIVRAGELWLLNMDIEPYEKASVFQHERRRERKLLLHRKEIDIIDRKAMEKGLTVVPLQVYFKNGRAKVEIALARGKAHYDKRDQIAKDDARRDVERELGRRG